MARLLVALISASCALAAAAAPLSKAELAILRERDARYAQPMPSEFAQLLAAKIGREGNMDGLREIVRLGDVELLRHASSAYKVAASRQIPEAIEALIVEHYGDAKLQPALLGFLARELEKRERYPKYRSRRLFELLHADVAKGSFSHSIRIIATDLAG